MFHTSNGQQAVIVTDFGDVEGDWQPRKTAAMNAALGLSLTPEQCRRDYLKKEFPELLPQYIALNKQFHTDSSFVLATNPVQDADRAINDLSYDFFNYTVTSRGRVMEITIPIWHHARGFGGALVKATEYEPKGPTIASIDGVVAVVESDAYKIREIAAHFDSIGHQQPLFYLLRQPGASIDVPVGTMVLDGWRHHGTLASKIIREQVCDTHHLHQYTRAA